MTEPREGLNILMPSGIKFYQPIAFDFYPRLCSNCGRLDQFVTTCVAGRQSNNTKRGSHASTVGGFLQKNRNSSRPPTRNGWILPQHRKGRGNNRNDSRPPNRDGWKQEPPKGDGQGYHRNRSVSRAPSRGRSKANPNKAAAAAEPTTNPGATVPHGDAARKEGLAASAGPSKASPPITAQVPPNTHIYFNSPLTNEGSEKPPETEAAATTPSTSGTKEVEPEDFVKVQLETPQPSPAEPEVNVVREDPFLVTTRALQDIADMGLNVNTPSLILEGLRRNKWRKTLVL